MQSVGYNTLDEVMQAIDLIKFYAEVAPVIQADVNMEAFNQM